MPQKLRPQLSDRSQRPGSYHKFLDGRKRPVRGLWQRSDRYYARLAVTDRETGRTQVRRVPLKGATTAAQAQAELRRLQTQREDGELPVLRQAPKFSDYMQSYLAYYEAARDAKRWGTLATERVHLRAWQEHLGETRLAEITPAKINAYIARRQAGGWTGRTVNLSVTILRNVLNRAIDEGWIRSLPTQNPRPLKWSPRKKELFQMGAIDRLCEAALSPRYCGGRLAQPGEEGRPLRNARQFVDYLRLMAFCGSRLSETLRLKWSDVDWERKQLTVGSDGLAKNHEMRVVDFNPKLEAHLQDMVRRRPPGSEWLFPSPQRGEQDRPSRTFRESLLLACSAAKLPKFGFHDCRHFFISYGIMAGIDYMTIARWVGHKDGGLLIGKVYGHLADEHRKRMAQKLSFAAVDNETPTPLHESR